jgi:hypothetical protein
VKQIITYRRFWKTVPQKNNVEIMEGDKAVVNLAFSVANTSYIQAKLGKLNPRSAFDYPQCVR